MAFFKVKKGEKEAFATESTFHDVFEPAGWERVEKNKSRLMDEWAGIDEDDLSERPISELSPEEVKKLAQKKGVSIDGKSIKQLRDEIKKIR